MKALLKPEKMQPGQTVGLIAPASALPKPELLPKAVAALEAFGYHVKVGESCLARHGNFAGEDALRARDVNAMFRDDTVDAILCARGGYGAMRILDMLDYDAIRANPKVLSGYSDITALHSAILEKTGLVTFHGLMAVSDMAHGDENDAFSLDAFWRVVSRAKPAGLLQNPVGCGHETLRPGRAEGRLVGGNLSLITACLGTPWAYDFDGAILFLEDVDEQPYAVDRMLTHLKNAGVFGRVSGVVLGNFMGCENKPDAPHLSLREVFAEVFEACPVPVYTGLQCGHENVKLTLPFGVHCAMDADAGTLEVLESAVA